MPPQVYLDEWPEGPVEVAELPELEFEVPVPEAASDPVAPVPGLDPVVPVPVPPLGLVVPVAELDPVPTAPWSAVGLPPGLRPFEVLADVAADPVPSLPTPEPPTLGPSSRVPVQPERRAIATTEIRSRAWVFVRIRMILPSTSCLFLMRIVRSWATRPSTPRPGRAGLDVRPHVDRSAREFPIQWQPIVSRRPPAGRQATRCRSSSVPLRDGIFVASAIPLLRAD